MECTPWAVTGVGHQGPVTFGHLKPSNSYGWLVNDSGTKTNRLGEEN